ncbi:AbrB/MazE/SpoVT family DNA-binding domain-containing protein [Rhizobium tumorigenes]|uniref:AbrB/MazE/SpoVT family DNA-binding domain-containing protein n=1 Tax=Rhizobium tumorigenes TaxID=2041385 RepID=A0AAF1K2P0_9HYPH|nr:AbrB/MazE/SpoVT family DNA-binding domain-containing protein [Rhizobium tumorigenes]WFR94484.1 AbrB/MazE/SpoVT family DNA-binding domain-containing protein [Rhizobium tumorigenes]WFR99966.1 AbrB/MazE/SpoVT family DNA-binding domain-containing protein [Rhizobium tumorigenes]
MTIWEATLSAKGQVTIPKEMREALNLRPGDQLVYSVIDGEVVMTAKTIELKDLAGYLGNSPKGHADIADIDAAAVSAAGASVFDTRDDDSSDVAA